MMAALRFDDPRPEALLRLLESDWKQLLEFGDLAHLTLPLTLQNQATVPDWVWARAGQNLADNRERGRRIAEAYREIADAFAGAGVDHLVIKGFAQYPDFASALDTRMQSDIDLYCPRPMIPAAQENLKMLGYTGVRALANYPADHIPEMTRRGDWRWRGNFYDPQMPPAVDLHYCFWNEGALRVPIAGVNEFWDRREMREGFAFSFPGLCTIDNLAFSALHILRDLLRGDWVLHHVYEVAWFLEKRSEDDSLWKTWGLIHDPRLRSLQTVSFFLARQWFGCRCSSVVEQETDRLALPIRQWLERFSQSPLTGMFTPNKHGLWLHLALLPTAKDKLFILGNTLMPLRLPRPGTEAQAATKTRRLRRFWPSQRHVRYVLHVIFRTAFHLRTIPGTLWHGLDWWYAQRRAGKTA
jgi:hypothetical protein